MPATLQMAEETSAPAERSRRRSHFRSAAAALGLTTICLQKVLQPLVRPDHDLVYHWSGRVSVLFGPVAIAIAATWAVLALLLFTAERPGRWRLLVWSFLLVLLPGIVVRNLAAWPGLVPHWLKMPPIWVALVLWLAVALAVLRSPRLQSKCEAVIGVASTVLAFVALSGALFLAEFTVFWWQARALNAPRPLHRTQAAASTHRPRIIWIVLDELSYRQVYGHRYSGLQLPAFDALAKQATVFTQVTPAANYTQRAVPSMFTGKPVDNVRSSANGLLSIHLARRNQWSHFSGHDTVFQDALNAGYSTAVDGWFNPYCRILPAVLDRCYWTDHWDAQSSMVTKADFKSIVAGWIDTVVGHGAIRRVAGRVLGLPDTGGPRPELHLEDYRQLTAGADQVLLDREAGFAFLHLPIPHPEGIYNRRTGQLTTGPSTYIDNLALADRYLAHVRDVLTKTGQWDSSTIVVMGDHGWRTSLVWESEPDWTPEEERASLRGTFDTRPAYIVKLAGQTSGTSIDAPFNAVRTRMLMDALMTGKVRTPDDLKAWVMSGEPVKTQYVAAAR